MLERFIPFPPIQLFALCQRQQPLQINQIKCWGLQPGEEQERKFAAFIENIMIQSIYNYFTIYYKCYYTKHLQLFYTFTVLRRRASLTLRSCGSSMTPPSSSQAQSRWSTMARSSGLTGTASATSTNLFYILTLFLPFFRTKFIQNAKVGEF